MTSCGGCVQCRLPPLHFPPDLKTGKLSSLCQSFWGFQGRIHFGSQWTCFVGLSLARKMEKAKSPHKGDNMVAKIPQHDLPVKSCQPATHDMLLLFAAPNNRAVGRLVWPSFPASSGLGSRLSLPRSRSGWVHIDSCRKACHDSCATVQLDEHTSSANGKEGKKRRTLLGSHLPNPARNPSWGTVMDCHC